MHFYLVLGGLEEKAWHISARFDARWNLTRDDLSPPLTIDLFGTELVQTENECCPILNTKHCW